LRNPCTKKDKRISGKGSKVKNWRGIELPRWLKTDISFEPASYYTCIHVGKLKFTYSLSLTHPFVVNPFLGHGKDNGRLEALQVAKRIV